MPMPESDVIASKKFELDQSCEDFKSSVTLLENKFRTVSKEDNEVKNSKKADLLNEVKRLYQEHSRLDSEWSSLYREGTGDARSNVPEPPQSISREKHILDDISDSLEEGKWWK